MESTNRYQFYYLLSIAARRGYFYASKFHLVDEQDNNQKIEVLKNIFENALQSVELSIQRQSDILSNILSEQSYLEFDNLLTPMCATIEKSIIEKIIEVNSDISNIRIDDLLSLYFLDDLPPGPYYLIIGNYLYYRHCLLCPECKDKYLEEFLNRDTFLDREYSLPFCQLGSSENNIAKISDKYQILDINYNLKDFWEQYSHKFISNQIESVKSLLIDYESFSFSFNDYADYPTTNFSEINKIKTSNLDEGNKKYQEIIQTFIRKYLKNIGYYFQL